MGKRSHKTRGGSARTEASAVDRNDYLVGHASRWLLTGLYIGAILFFVAVWLKGTRNHLINILTNADLIIPLSGALWGFRRLRSVRQPVFRSYLKVPMLFCAGLLSWSIGSIIWMYYNLRFNDEIPYPSWADAGYMPLLLCWTLGITFLYRQIGAYLLKDLSAFSTLLVFFWTVTGTIWTVTGTIMFRAHGGSLSAYSPTSEVFKFTLDISYPIVDALNLALLLALILSPKFKNFDPAMRKALRIISGGYFLLLVADFYFNIISTFPKSSPLAYYNGGPTDFIFSGALYVLSIGVSYMPFGALGRIHHW